MSGAFLLLSSATPAAETVTLTVDRDVVCIGEAITGSASLDYYGGNERPSVTISPALPENQMPDAGPSTKVFSFQTSESSTPGDHIITATASGAYPATKTVKVIKLEIEINNTASTDDDVVSWSDFIICRTRFQTPARIRQVPASGSSASDLEVTLSNSSRLEYAQSGGWGKTLSLTLPQDGSWIDFLVSGTLPSLAVGDAPIDVQVSGHSSTCFRKPMTVFWFTGDLNLTSGSQYEVMEDGNHVILGPSPGNALEMTAYADIKPNGVSASAPQISELRVGIVQNVRSSVHSGTYTQPQPIRWNSSYPQGRLAYFPIALLALKTLPSPMLDSGLTKSPLYESQVEKPRNLGGSEVTSHDNPHFRQPQKRKGSGRTQGGRVVAHAEYSIASMTIDDTYRTWCVVYNTRTKKVMRPLQQADWSLPAITDSSAARALAQGAVEAHDCPIKDPPFANDSTTLVVTPSAQTVAIPKP